MSKNLYAITILILTLLVNHSIAQKKNDKSKESPPLTIKANLIVLDENNKFDYNIKKEDIKIFEDDVEQKTTSFVQKPTVMSVGFVIDNSGSMRLKLKDLIKSSSTLINSLLAKDEAFIVRFVSSDKIEVIEDWTSDKKKLNSALEILYVEGGRSAIIDALYLSNEKILQRRKSHPTGRYALVLLSDGEERNSYYSYEQLKLQLKDTDTQIFMISYASVLANKNKWRKAVNFAHLITLDTGGTPYFVNKRAKKQDIINFFKAIILELRSPYIIGYNSTNQARNRLTRNLRIEIADSADGKKRRGFSRSKFVVPVSHYVVPNSHK